MRLILKLLPTKSHKYINDYHYYLESAIYSLIKEGGLPDLHERMGYKFFCFSNIFPYGDFQESVKKNLIISSPDPEILKSIESSCIKRKNSDQPLQIGNIEFKILNLSKPYQINFSDSRVDVASATPIIIRIPRRNFEKYGINLKINYNYLFWRDSVPFEAFINQLYDNMSKKVVEFLKLHQKILNGLPELNERDLVPEITRFKFIRSIAKPITIKGIRHIIIGSIWNLSFFTENKYQKRALAIALDAGLGERNSLGFGFVNPADNVALENS